MNFRLAKNQIGPLAKIVRAPVAKEGFAEKLIF